MKKGVRLSEMIVYSYRGRPKSRGKDRIKEENCKDVQYNFVSTGST